MIFAGVASAEEAVKIAEHAGRTCAAGHFLSGLFAKKRRFADVAQKSFNAAADQASVEAWPFLLLPFYLTTISDSKRDKNV